MSSFTYASEEQFWNKPVISDKFSATKLKEINVRDLHFLNTLIIFFILFVVLKPNFTFCKFWQLLNKWFKEVISSTCNWDKSASIKACLFSNKLSNDVNLFLIYKILMIYRFKLILYFHWFVKFY